MRIMGTFKRAFVLLLSLTLIYTGVPAFLADAADPIGTDMAVAFENPGKEPDYTISFPASVDVKVGSNDPIEIKPSFNIDNVDKIEGNELAIYVAGYMDYWISPDNVNFERFLLKHETEDEAIEMYMSSDNFVDTGSEKFYGMTYDRSVWRDTDNIRPLLINYGFLNEKDPEEKPAGKYTGKIRITSYLRG